MEDERIYAEVRIDFFDEIRKKWTVDAWYTNNSYEEGQVIAKIDAVTGTVEYLEPIAKDDPYVRETINDFLKDFQEDFQYVVNAPNLGTVLFEDGDGTKMRKEDFEEGYNDYMDYTILEGRNAGDTGTYYYYRDSRRWTDAIPSALNYVFELDKETVIAFDSMTVEDYEKYEKDHAEIEY